MYSYLDMQLMLYTYTHTHEKGPSSRHSGTTGKTAHGWGRSHQPTPLLYGPPPFYLNIEDYGGRTELSPPAVYLYKP
jgi:hypothetical protein